MSIAKNIDNLLANLALLSKIILSLTTMSLLISCTWMGNQYFTLLMRQLVFKAEDS